MLFYYDVWIFTHSIAGPIWFLAILICFIYEFYLDKETYRYFIIAFVLFLLFRAAPIVQDITQNVLWISQEGDLQRSSADDFRLFDMGINGKWMGELEGLMEYVNLNIGDDSFVQIPCEDPIYWATGTVPQLDFFQLYIETCPYNVSEVFEKVVGNNTKWVIIKDECQFKAYMIQGDILINFASDLEEMGYVNVKK